MRGLILKFKIVQARPIKQLRALHVDKKRKH